MSKSDSYDRAKFERVGEQAARTLGSFMSMATQMASDFSDEYNRHRNGNGESKKTEDANKTSGAQNSDDQKYDEISEQSLREAGEQLRKMREAAGYTLDSLCKALEKEFPDKQFDDIEVITKVKAAESGHQPLPREWLSQISELLSDHDSLGFFRHLQQSYHSKAANSDSAKTQPKLSDRVQKFSAIFENDADLDQLTDSQFERLIAFIEKSYQDAKTLVVCKNNTD